MVQFCPCFGHWRGSASGGADGAIIGRYHGWSRAVKWECADASRPVEQTKMANWRISAYAVLSYWAVMADYRQTDLFLPGDFPASSGCASLELRPLLWGSWWIMLNQNKQSKLLKTGSSIPWFSILTYFPASSLIYDHELGMQKTILHTERKHWLYLHTDKAQTDVKGQLTNSKTHFFLIPIGVFLCQEREQIHFLRKV